jgi:predicted membrane chloride channel (bestrophin family)
MWQSKTLRRNWARKRRELRQDLENWLPEVKKLPESRQAAAEVTMCFETWYQLRYDQRLTHKETVASINEMLCLLFEIDPV